MAVVPFYIQYDQVDKYLHFQLSIRLSFHFQHKKMAGTSGDASDAQQASESVNSISGQNNIAGKNNIAFKLESTVHRDRSVESGK